MGLTVAADSDTGRVRQYNEDSYCLGERVWAVADGMGGQVAGDQASRIAMRCVEDYDRAGPLDQTAIACLVTEMNTEILAYGASHPYAAGLGTTLAGISLVTLAGQNHWLVFNIGDSRVYRLTDGVLNRETVDHSEVQILVNLGEISSDQARTHPGRNVLTRCLGSALSPKVDTKLVPYCPGDRLLICSDGLTTEVEDGIIEMILQTASDPSEAVDRLVGTAVEQGGRDNVTVVVVEVDPVEGRGDCVEDTLSYG